MPLIKLSDVEIDLLRISAAEMCQILTTDTKTESVKQAAYDYYIDGEHGEMLQVQVVVTRRKADFLKPFQTEYTNS